MKIGHLAAVLTIGAAMLLSSCGGDGSGSPPSQAITTLSGTAAAGAPLIGQVTVKDSAGVLRTVPLAADGTFTVDVSGLTPPFLLRAEGTVGGRSYVLHSAATAADINGNVNVTPLTDLIVANIAQQVAANYYDSGAFGGLTTAELDAAEAVLQQRLQAVLTDLGVAPSVDLLRTSFSANNSGLDAALDILRVSVDPTTNTALITNVINNASITDDLTTTDTSIIDSTSTTSGVTDWDAIRARIASFEASFATGLPSASDPLLLAQFDQTGFLMSGKDLAAFLGDITTDPGLVGITFASVTLVDYTPATSGTNGSALITLGDGDPIYGYEFIGFVMTGIYETATGGTNWVIAGDQRIADVYAAPRAILGFNSTDPTQIENGVEFEIDEDGPGNIDYAVITGPGLPTTGGGADGSSAGVLLGMQPLFGGDFWVVSSPYSGPATNPLADVHPRAQNHFPMYSMTDAEIAALPASNLTYTADLYDDNGSPANLTDDVLLATYSMNVQRPPLAASTLTPASFPQITSPSVAELNSVGVTGGPLTLIWSVPSGLGAESIDAVRFYSDGSSDGGSADLEPTDTSITVQVTPPTGTPVGGMFTISAYDFFGRGYQRRFFTP